jgi:putative redox protein
MEAKVTWHGNMTFTGSADSGFTVPIGTSSTANGNEDGFRPMELIATGLAGCTAMDVVTILHKKREKITAFEVSVVTEQAGEHPKVFTRVTIQYQITGNRIDETSVRRAIELSATRYCPAQAMFSQIMPIELKYQIFEADGAARNLITMGEYIPSLSERRVRSIPE